MAFVKEFVFLMCVVYVAVQVHCLDLSHTGDELEEVLKELRGEEETRGLKDQMAQEVDAETVKQLAKMDRKSLEKMSILQVAQTDDSAALIKDVTKIRRMSDTQLRSYLRPKVDGEINDMLSKLNKRDLELVKADKEKRFWRTAGKTMFNAAKEKCGFGK